MFQAQVYRIAIQSLGAIIEEEHIAQESIAKWNELHGEQDGILFLQSTSDHSDLNVVIIDSFIDIAKVDRVMSSGRPSILFFSKHHDPKNTIQAELDAIKTYREMIQNTCTCVDYENTIDFAKVFMAAVERFVTGS